MAEFKNTESNDDHENPIGSIKPVIQAVSSENDGIRANLSAAAKRDTKSNLYQETYKWIDRRTRSCGESHVSKGHLRSHLLTGRQCMKEI